MTHRRAVALMILATLMWSIAGVVTRHLEAEYDIEQIKPGDVVSIHWSVACEVITPQQAAMLKKYTARHLAMANQTI